MSTQRFMFRFSFLFTLAKNDPVWMDKQIVIYNGMLFSYLKDDQTTDTTWNGSQSTMFSERRQAQKTPYHLIPCTWNSREGKENRTVVVEIEV